MITYGGAEINQIIILPKNTILIRIRINMLKKLEYYGIGNDFVEAPLRVRSVVVNEPRGGAACSSCPLLLRYAMPFIGSWRLSRPPPSTLPANLLFSPCYETIAALCACNNASFTPGQ